MLCFALFRLVCREDYWVRLRENIVVENDELRYIEGLIFFLEGFWYLF